MTLACIYHIFTAKIKVHLQVAWLKNGCLWKSVDIIMLNQNAILKLPNVSKELIVTACIARTAFNSIAKHLTRKQF